MGLSHRFDQVLSFVFGHVTQSCSCAPAIAGVRWIRSSVQVRFSSRLTIERLEGHACAVLTTALSPRIILLCPVKVYPSLTSGTGRQGVRIEFSFGLMDARRRVRVCDYNLFWCPLVPPNTAASLATLVFIMTNNLSE